jgi:hypothetical protein
MKKTQSKSNMSKEVKKMRNIGIMAFMALLVVGIAAAAGSFVAPGASAIIKGVYKINVSTDRLNNVTNCTVTISSVLSGSQAATQLLLNRSGDATYNYANASYDTAQLKDASDYVFSATCRYNQTTTETVTRTGITIDNTVPGCIFNSALKDNSQYPSTQTWKVACANATAASIKFGSNAGVSMSESYDVCTFTGDTKSVPQGSYSSVQVRASDGYNVTQCVLSNIIINTGSLAKQVGGAVALSGAGQKMADAASVSVKNNNALFILVIGGIAAWWFIRKKR